MCTLSWWRRDGRLSVRFNRDEQKGRPTALLPRERMTGTHPVLSPEDPLGGGTWICVDTRGTVHCLLNNYEATAVFPLREPVRSRGELPLLSAASPDLPLTDLLPTLLLRHYQPFHLLRIPLHGETEHACWTGSDG